MAGKEKRLFDEYKLLLCWRRRNKDELTKNKKGNHQNLCIFETIQPLLISNFNLQNDRFFVNLLCETK